MGCSVGEVYIYEPFDASYIITLLALVLLFQTAVRLSLEG